MLPLFVNLTGRDVLLVGGGQVAASKLHTLLDAGARVRVVAPEVCDEIARLPLVISRRPFVPADLDGAWLVVAAATPDVNRQVAEAAEPRQVFVNAVDDPAHATAFMSGTLRRDGVTLAISTDGGAPGLTALVREALDALLPDDVHVWMERATAARAAWKRDGVPMERRKPLLLQTLNRLYEDPTSAGRYEGQADAGHDEGGRGQRAEGGHVSIVGAGPGDPGLLTRKALARLRAADLVLYDALIDPRVLRYARKAQRFFVGKRAGRHAMTQDAVHRVMIRAARRGRSVVRLKGGDPFVFGRGGEETQALARAGVPFDVVPGVTSAIAAPALAGIPVTDRRASSALLVVSGHDLAAFGTLTAGAAADDLTLVVMMGIGRAAAIASALITRGWRTETPAAIVVNASAPDQQVWRGALGQLGDAADKIGSSAPGTIVIGRVVNLAGASAHQDSAYVSNR